MLIDPNADQETVYAEKDEFDFRKTALCFSQCPEGQRSIEVNETTFTLEILSLAYGGEP